MNKDLMGKAPQVGDVIAIAFERWSRGVLRLGVIESLYPPDRADIKWQRASEGGLPTKPVTNVWLRNYVILEDA